MAISRPPKSIVPLGRELVGIRRITVNGNEGTPIVRTFECERDRRPSYAYGAKSTLPGGSKWISPTAYTHNSWTVSDFPPATLRWTQVDGEYFRFDSGADASALIGQFVAVLGNLTDARNEAVTKALNQIADQKINLGENLATFRQTLGMFTTRAAKLNGALHSGLRNKSLRPYLRKTARQARREGTLNNAANLYLEYIYGLKPLMDDVYTGYELLKKQAVESLLLSGAGSGSRQQAGKPRRLSTGYGSYEVVSAQATGKVKCKLYARIDPNHKGLRSLNQLGLLNPLGLAWDLTPFSFVLDWFVPIGPVLYALSAPAGLSFIGGTVSTRTSETHSVKFTCGDSMTGRTLISESPSYPVVTYEGYNRQTLTNWPLPGAWVSPNPFSGDRSLKALALSIATLSGKINIR